MRLWPSATASAPIMPSAQMMNLFRPAAWACDAEGHVLYRRLLAEAVCVRRPRRRQPATGGDHGDQPRRGTVRHVGGTFGVHVFGDNRGACATCTPPFARACTEAEFTPASPWRIGTVLAPGGLTFAIGVGMPRGLQEPGSVAGVCTATGGLWAPWSVLERALDTIPQSNSGPWPLQPSTLKNTEELLPLGVNAQRKWKCPCSFRIGLPMLLSPREFTTAWSIAMTSAAIWTFWMTKLLGRTQLQH